MNEFRGDNVCMFHTVKGVAEAEDGQQVAECPVAVGSATYSQGRLTSGRDAKGSGRQGWPWVLTNICVLLPM